MNFNPEEPIFPPGIPEEFKEQIQAHHQHHRAMMQDNTHAARQLLDDLTLDQLSALDIIISDVMTHKKYTGSYWRGQIVAMKWARYETCPCGQSHDPNDTFDMGHEQHLGETQEPNQQTHLKGQPIEDVDLLHRDFITTPDNEVVEVGSERWNVLMLEYNLVVYYDDDSVMHFQCSICQTNYPSLQDRMLKKAGKSGCDNCVQQEKWG